MVRRPEKGAGSLVKGYRMENDARTECELFLGLSAYRSCGLGSPDRAEVEPGINNAMSGAPRLIFIKFPGASLS